MASLKDLRDRIASVKATQKITKAMQMVAAAKLRKAQEAVESSRPYSSKMVQLIANISADLPAQDLPALLRMPDNPQRYLLVIATAERGLCGGFNSQIVRLARAKILELLAAGKEVKILTIGKKGADMLRREFASLMIEHISLREIKNLQYQQVDAIAKNILTRFEQQEFDVCLFVYSQFKSVIQQEPKILPLVPAGLDESAKSESSSNFSFEYEPSRAALLEDLVKHNVSTQIFTALLENIAGEMGAKMTAMDNATRNAGDMIGRLSITYNRQRQARITTELIEIISGAEAL